MNYDLMLTTCSFQYTLKPSNTARKVIGRQDGLALTIAATKIFLENYIPDGWDPIW